MLIPWTGFILLAICARIFDNCWSTLFITSEEHNFLWGQTQQESFDHLKQLLICAPVLAFPDFNQEFILETDASGKGLGAILAQKQPDGFTRPIAYASRTLQQHKMEIQCN